MTGPIFHTWLRPARLISCDGQQAVIAATSRYHSEELRTRLSLHIAHTLGTVIGAPVTCAYVPLSELVGQNGTGPQPPTPAG